MASLLPPSQPTPYGTSMLTSGTAAQTSYRSYPSSFDEAKSRTPWTSGEGVSTSNTTGSNMMVKGFVTLGRWPSDLGYSDAESTLDQGVITFAARVPGAQDTVPTLSFVRSIAMLNEFFRQSYLSAQKNYTRNTDASGNERPGSSVAETSGWLTISEFDSIFKRPSSTWITNPAFQRLLVMSDSEARDIRYLSHETIVDEWNMLGTPENTVPSLRARQMEYIVGGVGKEVCNHWGNHLRAGHKLMLILKRVNFSTDETSDAEWGHFAFHYFANFDGPAIEDIAYADVCGYPQFGITRFVGSVIEHGKDVEVDETRVRVCLGLTKHRPVDAPVKLPIDISLFVHFKSLPNKSVWFN